MKLSRKIPLLIGIVVLVTVISFFIPIEIFTANSIKESHFEDLYTRAEANAVLINSKIEGRLGVLYEIANRQRTRSMDWEGMVRQNLLPVIDRLDVLELFIIYPDGSARYVTDNSTGSLGDRDYFLKAMNGNTTVSDVIISRSINRPVVIFASPIFANDEPDAPVLGVLAAREDGSALSDIVDVIKTRFHGDYAFMINNEGTLIAHPDNNMVLNRFNIFHELQYDPSLTSLADICSYAIYQRNGTGYYTFNGKKYMAAFAEVPDYPWLLFVVMEEGQIGAELSETFILLIAIGFICLIVGIMTSFLIGRSIAKPVTRFAEALKNIAEGEGDLTAAININSKDELGDMALYFNMTLEKIRLLVKNIKDTIVRLRESAQNMLAISSQMADNSSGLKEQTSSVNAVTEEFSAGMTQSSYSLSKTSEYISDVAASIEEINATINTVAASAEQTSVSASESSALVDNIKNSITKASDSVALVSDSFNNVAQSIEEIKKSIFIVSEHCAATGVKMSEADNKAKNTDHIIQRLEKSSREIGKIVDLISDIADQTNLLALNAAIEAAGAGKAGAGFMVVANEVKELAKETASATDEITNKIENMQINLSEAVKSVSEIAAVIKVINEGGMIIVKEVEQQSKRSDKIADDSAEAARRMSEIAGEINRISDNALSVTNTVAGSSAGANEIARAIAELVIGTREIAMNSERASSDISEIDRAAKDMTDGLLDISKNIQLINNGAGEVQRTASFTKISSEELLKTASDMEGFVSKFKIA